MNRLILPAICGVTMLLASCAGDSPMSLPALPTPAVEKPLSLARNTPAEQVAGPAVRAIDRDKVGRAVDRYRVNHGDKEAIYEIAGADLDGDNSVEALVFLSGEDWCNPTGCTLMIMRKGVTGYDVVSLVKRVRLPVGISPRSTSGWRDLLLVTGQPGTQRLVRLQFDGSGYPKNASVLPPVQAGETERPEIALRAPPRTAIAAGTNGDLISGQN